MRSPIAALLWEQWRLTRVELCVRLGFGLVAASLALALLESGATAAFGILLITYAPFWLSLGKLNGGGFTGGYKPGFPLHLSFTRPVSTLTLVSVAMAYDALSCAALYLVCAASLGLVFGETLPLFSVIPLIVTFHCGLCFIHWATRSRVMPIAGLLVLGTVFFVIVLIKIGAAPTLRVDFTPGGYLRFVCASLAFFGLTLHGVARQRHGGKTPVHARLAGYPHWLIDVFRLPCPTSSATRAQMWFELKTSGLPVLTIGLAISLLVFVLFGLSIPFEIFRPLTLAAAMITVWALPVSMFIGGNAFGFRQRQGRMLVSAFEATQPYATARIAGLKILVRSVCVLAALGLVAASLWVSSEVVTSLHIWGISLKGQDMGAHLLEFRENILGTLFGGRSGAAYIIQAVSIAVFVALLVALRAAFTALRARYPRRLLAAEWLLALCIGALVLLGVAKQKGMAPAATVDAIFSATAWIMLGAAAIATAYLTWSGFRERTLSVHYVAAAVVVAAVSGLASPAAQSPLPLSISWLLPLSVLLVAPWALGRIRHA